MHTSSADVIVIGGGITGTATAYELAKRGVTVTLLERGEIAAMASGWTLAGVRQSGRHVAELPLAVAAVRRWEGLAEELGSDIEYRQDGNLRLALTDEDVPVIRKVVEDGHAAGLPIKYLDGQEAVWNVAPVLTESVRGAAWCTTDGHANNHLAVKAFADAAARHGATIRTGVHVESLQVEGDRVTGVVTRDGVIPGGTVVVAAGIYSPSLLAPLGLELPMTVTLCPVIQTEPVEPTMRQVLGIASGEFAGRQKASGRFRFIGMSEAWMDDKVDPYDPALTLRDMHRTITTGVAIIPMLSDLRIHKSWGGLIDRTPDVIPVLDRVPSHEGLVVAAGFSGHGFGIGPVTGEVVADLATWAAPRFELSAFTLARFEEASQEQEDLQLHG
jgi:sarcosine oxidase, subunit beta